MADPFQKVDPKIYLLEGLPILTLDVETTFQVENGKKNPSPHIPKNNLVSVGYKRTLHTKKSISHIDNYLCFFHNTEACTPNAIEELQDVLDDTLLIIGHHLKFDIEWLLISGFNLDSVNVSIWDTMLVEYIFLRALPKRISLEEVLKRRGLTPKYEGMHSYLDKNISVEDIPWDVVLNRGRGDVNSTYELFLDQLKDLEIEDIQDLLNAYNWKDFRETTNMIFGKENGERPITNDNINKSNVHSLMPDPDKWYKDRLM